MIFSKDVVIFTLLRVSLNLVKFQGRKKPLKHCFYWLFTLPVTNPCGFKELDENITYNLVSKISNVNNTYISNFGEYFIISFNGDVKYTTTNVSIGELKITKLDTQQKIISGTFWYDAINASGEKVEVREGRFDMRYVN